MPFKASPQLFTGSPFFLAAFLYIWVLFLSADNSPVDLHDGSNTAVVARESVM